MVKINIESEQPLELPPEEPQKPVIHHVRDKVPAWQIRAENKIQRESKARGRFTLPSSTDDLLGFIGVWFMLPLAFIVIFSSLEQQGWDLRGLTLLTLAGVVGVGCYLYAYLRAYPDDFPAILARIVTFTIALALGVAYATFF